jgi:hypothetical protein
MAAGVLLGDTVIEYARAVCPPNLPPSSEAVEDPSVTEMVKAKLPARVGIPEILPVRALRANPAGNEPSLTTKL